MIERFLIATFSFISCFLFGKLQIKTTVSVLSNSYKNQYRLILDNSIADELKQKQLLENIVFQLRNLGLLIIKIIALVSPFILFYLIAFLGLNINTQKLVEMEGIVISLVSVMIFVAIEKSYVKLFQNK